ncbi:MAG: hypothetical protein AB7F40_04310 [Victivallaceae bacterium]
MSLNLGVMNAAVALDDGDFNKKVRQLPDTAETYFKRVATLAAGYLTLRAVFEFVTGSMSEFSKLEEGNNKLKYAFSELSDEAARSAKTIANTFGLSAQTATNAIADIGDLLTGLGFSQADSLGFAKSITERGIDVASFKGLDQTETIRRMTVALTGETESLKTMGIVVRQGSAEFQGQVKAIMASTGATETQAKAQAILKEIMKQTANAAGDYLRPDAPRTYQQEVTDLGEAMRRFNAEVGATFQPITQSTVVNARELLTWYNELTPSARNLTNATAGLAASMLIMNSTKFGMSIMGAGKTSSSGDVESAKIKATEEVKRSETEMTTAQLEADFAKQNLEMAKNAVAAAENAEAFAKAELVKAEASGDTAKIADAQGALLIAQRDVTAAKLKESKAASELHSKTVALSVATERYKALTLALPGVLKAIAASSTLAGKASLFTAGGFRAAGAAIKSFFAALGPVGWAILAAAVAFEAVSAAVTIYNSNLEENARNAKNAADAAADATAKNHDDNVEKVNSMSRLQELQKYEKLNNAEREEAKRLLEETGIAYDANGQSIDEMLSRMGAEKRSLAELIELRKQELKERRIAALEDQIAKNEKAAEVNSEQGVGAWGTFGRSAVSFGMWTGEGKNAEIDAENKKLYSDNDKLRQELRKLKGGELDAGETEADRNQHKNEVAESQRRALESLSGREWEIRFNSGSIDEQVSMLTQKMNTVFSEYKRTGKYSSIDAFKTADRSTMTENELKDLQKIVDLEDQRKRLIEQSSQAIQSESESYSDYLIKRQKAQADKAVERSLSFFAEAGDTGAQNAIIESQLAGAQRAAESARYMYENAFRTASADGIMAEEERKALERLRRKMEDTQTEADRWADKQYEFSERERSDRNHSVSTGAWSSKILAAMLGNTSPAEETARNTKESVRILREINNKGGTGSLSYS